MTRQGIDKEVRLGNMKLRPIATIDREFSMRKMMLTIRQSSLERIKDETR